jgi:phosphate starvation-inducible protein PhoH
VVFTHEDVIRHVLLARIVAAYEQAAAASPRKREGRE